MVKGAFNLYYYFMTQLLFEILTEDELKRLKSVGLTRNVRIKDLTLGEVSDLKNVFWPLDYPHEGTTFLDVIVQLQKRKAI